MNDLREKALLVDAAIAVLEQTVTSYIGACRDANRDHVLAGKPRQLYERAGDHVRNAVASRLELARHLDLQPVNPPVTTAQHHR